MHAGLKSLAHKMSAPGHNIGGLLGSFTRTVSRDDSSRDSPKAARRLGGLIGSFTRSLSGGDSSPRRQSSNAHQTDAAALQKESSLESTDRKDATRLGRASDQGPALHLFGIPLPAE